MRAWEERGRRVLSSHLQILHISVGNGSLRFGFVGGVFHDDALENDADELTNRRRRRVHRRRVFGEMKSEAQYERLGHVAVHHVVGRVEKQHRRLQKLEFLQAGFHQRPEDVDDERTAFFRNGAMGNEALDTAEANGNDFNVLSVAAENERLDEIRRRVRYRLDDVRRGGFGGNCPQAQNAGLCRFLSR